MSQTLASDFVHLDVLSAYSLYQSPSTPEDYAEATARLYSRHASRQGLEQPSDSPPPAIALADYNLASAVKMAVACKSHHVEHILGLRVRVVSERAYRSSGEYSGDLILLAENDQGWLNLVALNNLGHVAGWSYLGARIDWQDLASHSEGLVCLSGPPGRGLIPRAIEYGEDYILLARQLKTIFPECFYLELAYHRRPAERLVNRRVIELSERLDLPLVATNAVRFANPREALSATVLDAISRRRRTRGYGRGGGGYASTLTIDPSDALAHLRSPAEMWRVFGRIPQALQATREIAERCEFRLPLRGDTCREEHYGPALFLGLSPSQKTHSALRAAAREGLAHRFASEGRGEVGESVQARLDSELTLVADQPGLAEILLSAKRVGDYCSERRVPIAARGSVTSSLVAWALGLVRLCPLDHGLRSESFVYSGREDPPDVDLEVSSPHEPQVSAFALGQAGSSVSAPLSPRDRNLPARSGLRLGMKVTLGPRSAVRQAGAALGVDSRRLDALARLVPLVSAPGAIEQAIAKIPEQAIPDLSPGAEPAQTALAVASAIEGLPQRYGAHPTGIVFAPEVEGGPSPGLLGWLPVHFVGRGESGQGRGAVGQSQQAPRLADDEPPEGSSSELGLSQASTPARQEPEPPEPSEQWGEVSEAGDEERDATEDLPPLVNSALVGLSGGPNLCSQWDKDDLEALGIPKLDISASASLATVGPFGLYDTASARSALVPIERAVARAIETGQTLGVAQLETIGIRMLLKRAQDLYPAASGGFRMRDVEDLAQLLALWRPGAYSSEREEAYFAARLGRETPSYTHEAMADVLGRTGGQLLYEDQLFELVELLDADHLTATRYVRAISGHRYLERERLERALRGLGKALGWTNDQLSALFALLVEHAGYLFKHGHALALADRAILQMTRKFTPETSGLFFADLMSLGGSGIYGLGSAAEEARRLGVTILPPCVNRSEERYSVEEDGSAVRVPLSAIMGLSRNAARHVLAVRDAFGPFEGLLDFCRKVDPRLVTRKDLSLLVKLGAFSFTGLSRAQLTLAADYYSTAARLLRSSDRDPAGLEASDSEVVEALVRNVEVSEWPVETIAAYELAHLGFYASAPSEASIAAEAAGASFTPIAELVDHPKDAPTSVAGTITSVKVRLTRKGEAMAFLTVADSTGAIQCVLFPSVYEPITRRQVVREGAHVLIGGRVAQEEAGGPKLFVDDLRMLGGAGARRSALAASIGAEGD